MFNSAKWYRKLKGGYWIKYDMNGHMGATPDEWVQVDAAEYTAMSAAKEQGCYTAIRCKAFESYV